MDEDDDSNLANLRHYIMQRSSGNREVYRSSSAVISNLFVPIQPPKAKNE